MTFLIAVQAVSAGIGILGGIFGLLGKRKAQKKAKKIEQVARSIISGVEQFSRMNHNLIETQSLKPVIQAIAYKNEVENELHDLVKNTTEGKPFLTKVFK
jgi:16S rRNA U1498 N3-methylase RsmE